MITAGVQEKFKWPSINQKLYNLVGDISDEEARKYLAEFAMWNPGVIWGMLTGGWEMEAFQDLTLRSLLVKNFSMLVWSRGASKTELGAILCGLLPIIQPESQIVIASSGFRKSREILERLDKFCNLPRANLLRQCISEPLKRKNDLYSLKIGRNGSVVAIPLNPSVRGFRSTCLLVDEMLLIGEELFTSVLFPFLAARSGIQEILKIKNMEDLLIRQGLMKEEDREVVQNTKKVILLSSASYEFEFFFELYNKWIEQVIDAKKQDDKVKGTYFISQLGWEAIPKTIMDVNMVLQSKDAMSEAMFSREYGARFTKDSGSVFSMKIMEECTIPYGKLPCIELKSNGKSKYIIIIDTNLSASLTADHFGMKVMKIDYENKLCYDVHNFARAGIGFKDASRYFLYLLAAFNPDNIIADKGAGGWRFIEACLESELFKKHNIKLEEWKCDFDSEEYGKEIQQAKRTYNKEAGRFVYLQNFSGSSISKMTDNLSIYIEKRKVWFTSSLAGQEDSFQKALSILPDYLFLDSKDSKEKLIENLLDDQDNWMKGTKSETSLIEVALTPNGSRTYNLPQNIRRSDSPNRPRRDSFSCLLMGCWMTKVLFDIASEPIQEQSFPPMFLG